MEPNYREQYIDDVYAAILGTGRGHGARPLERRTDARSRTPRPGRRGEPADYMAAGLNYELRVGILFALYMVYATQPQAHTRCRIRINQGWSRRRCRSHAVALVPFACGR